MVTLIIPTRNRAYTLGVVASSYYKVELVTEIVFVIDGSSDDSELLLRDIAADNPSVSTKFIINAERKGASHCRQIGVEAASNAFVLFCDDDMFMQSNYAKICMAKLEAPGIGAVAGRHVFRQPGELPAAAIARFGTGYSRRPPFRYTVCEYCDDAYYPGDIKMPLVNSCILTRRDLVLRFGFDPYYSRGNGYREESDYQMNLFVHGLDIVATNDTHTVHLHRSEVRQGGQRSNRLKRVRWATQYTWYFYSKYWDRYAARVGLHMGRKQAIGLFFLYTTYIHLLRPLRHLLPRRTRRPVATAAIDPVGTADTGAR